MQPVYAQVGGGDRAGRQVQADRRGQDEQVPMRGTSVRLFVNHDGPLVRSRSGKERPFQTRFAAYDRCVACLASLP